MRVGTAPSITVSGGVRGAADLRPVQRVGDQGHGDDAEKAGHDGGQEPARPVDVDAGLRRQARGHGVGGGAGEEDDRDGQVEVVGRQRQVGAEARAAKKAETISQIVELDKPDRAAAIRSPASPSGARTPVAA